MNICVGMYKPSLLMANKVETVMNQVLSSQSKIKAVQICMVGGGFVSRSKIFGFLRRLVYDVVLQLGDCLHNGGKSFRIEFAPIAGYPKFQQDPRGC